MLITKYKQPFGSFTAGAYIPVNIHTSPPTTTIFPTIHTDVVATVVRLVSLGFDKMLQSYMYRSAY